MNEESLLKLFLSRDAQSELTRKVIGKRNVENFSDYDQLRSAGYLVELFTSIDHYSNQKKNESPHANHKSFSSENLPSMSFDHSFFPPAPSIDTTQSDKMRLVHPEKLNMFRTAGMEYEEPSPSLTILHHQQQHNDFFHTSHSATPTNLSSPATQFGSTDSYDRDSMPTLIKENSINSTKSSGNHRNPVIAKRNPNIERMINESALRHNRNNSPKVVQDFSRFSFVLSNNNNHNHHSLSTLSSSTPEKPIIPSALQFTNDHFPANKFPSIVISTASSSGVVITPINTPTNHNGNHSTSITSSSSSSMTTTSGTKVNFEKKMSSSMLPLRPVIVKPLQEIRHLSRSERIQYHLDMHRKVYEVSIF
jgi:hypothetical protein